MRSLIEIKTDINLKKLAKQILKNEPKIIKKYPPRGISNMLTDGGTGLGFDSLTSRFYHYNILKWWGTKSLKKYMRTEYETYTGIVGKPLYVTCWANVLRKGEKIGPHYHAISNVVPPSEHISANLCVQSGGGYTSTYYEMADNGFYNVDGKFTFFPGTMMHWTDEYTGSAQRVTVGCDINSERFFLYDIFDRAKFNFVKI